MSNDLEYNYTERFLTDNVIYCFQKFYRDSGEPVLDDNGMQTVEYSSDYSGNNLIDHDIYTYNVIDIDLGS